MLCTIEELNDLYQMPHYLENLVESGLTVSHFPIEDGKVPADMADFLQLLTTMAEALRKAKGLIQYVHLTSSLYMLYINNLIRAYIFEVPETAFPNLLPIFSDGTPPELNILEAD